MSQRRLRLDRRGLTLIELLLTLTILALAGALVSGAFATGLRAWQSGLRSGREELVARIVLERIATQLRAAILAPAKRNEERAVAFDAGEGHLRFVTLAAAGSAPVQVAYDLRADGGNPHLVYREYPWPDKDFFSAGRPRREEKVIEVTGFSVQVSRRISSSANTPSVTGAVPLSEEWSPLDKELPASVSVEIVVAAASQPESRRYQLTVPILTQGVLR